jgi:hypothetical protein
MLCASGRPLRINTLYHREPGLPDTLYQTDRTQQSRGVIDQKQESYNTAQSKEPRDDRHELVNCGLCPAQIPYPEKKRENEKTHRVPDDVVAQQSRCNNARRVLSAGDLNCHKEGCKCEDDERKRERGNRVEQRLGALDAKFEPLPSEPGVECQRQWKSLRDRSLKEGNPREFILPELPDNS